MINLILCRRCGAWIELGSHFANRVFCVFCIKKCVGSQGGVCRRLEIFLDPAVVSAAGRSKAVVPVLFLFCVALWFILQGASVLRSSRALCPRVSSFLLALRSPRLGKRETKRELVCVLLVHLFVCFVRVGFFVLLFLLVSGVGCGLWLWRSLSFSINFFCTHEGRSYIQSHPQESFEVFIPGIANQIHCYMAGLGPTLS